MCVCPFFMNLQLVSIKLHMSNTIGAHNHIFLLNTEYGSYVNIQTRQDNTQKVYRGLLTWF